MPDFQYKAMNGEGKVVTGFLSLDSREEAVAQLGSMGCTPISVVEKKVKTGGMDLFGDDLLIADTNHHRLRLGDPRTGELREFPLRR